MTNLLTDVEAADRLGLTPRQVTRLASRGELPKVVFPNREVRFDPADLARFVESHKHPVKPEAPPNREAREGSLPTYDPAKEQCQRCGELGDDRRNLWISCLSNLRESAIPFTEHFFANNNEGPRRQYMLRICKSCRSELIAAIEQWYSSSHNPRSTN